MIQDNVRSSLATGSRVSTWQGYELLEDYRQEASRLYKIEYGSRPELVFRFLVVLLGGLTLFTYTGEPVALIWMALYAIGHVVFHMICCRALRLPSRQSLRCINLFYPLVLALFIWLPVIVFARDDAALRVPAGAALLATLLFLVRRGDTSWILISGVLGIIGCAIFYVMSHTLLQVTDPMAYATVIISCAGCYVYFAMSLLTSRRMRLEAARAVRDMKETHKVVAIGRLSAGIAHEFNNILAGIRGNIELLRSYLPTRAARDCIDDAITSTDRGARLATQLQLFAQQGRMIPSWEDLSALVEAVADRLQPKLASGTHLSVQTGMKDGHVFLDPDLLEVVLDGLSQPLHPEAGATRHVTLSVLPLEIEAPIRAAGGTVLPAGRYGTIAVEEADVTTACCADDILDPFALPGSLATGAGLAISAAYGFAEQTGGGLLLRHEDGVRAIVLVFPLSLESVS